MWVCMSVEARVQPWVSFSVVSCLLFWDKISVNLELDWLPVNPRDLLASTFPSQAYVWLLHRFWGPQIGSSCLQSKRFPHWASPWPQSHFLNFLLLKKTYKVFYQLRINIQIVNRHFCCCLAKGNWLSGICIAGTQNSNYSLFFLQCTNLPSLAFKLNGLFSLIKTITLDWDEFVVLVLMIFL